MAMKRFTILALTSGIASAQMDGMDSTMDSVIATITPASSAGAVDTVTVVSSLSSTIAATDSVVPTSTTPDIEYSMPADNSTDETVSVPVDATDMTTASIMTDMPSTTAMSVTDMSSIITEYDTSSTMDMGMSGMPMGTGGVMPNVTATPIMSPISGDGMVNGVSIGLFLTSIALAALLQL
ncbi:hypothetical protein GGR57DRAFT_497735 [Xylariaceae sp. FL1272]|nr:hypothetical protein GGR57DRAFT_497735 [Xylariaceae sp. FL1272]